MFVLVIIFLFIYTSFSPIINGNKVSKKEDLPTKSNESLSFREGDFMVIGLMKYHSFDINTYVTEWEVLLIVFYIQIGKNSSIVGFGSCDYKHWFYTENWTGYGKLLIFGQCTAIHVVDKYS